MPKLLSRSRLSRAPVVAGQRGADLGVVQRHGGEEDAACRSGRSPGRRSRTRGSRTAPGSAVSSTLPPASEQRDARASYWFCGVWMSQSFSGFHFSVNAMRPSRRSLARNGLLVNSLTLRPSSRDLGAQRVRRVRRPGPRSAASTVISPLRTDVSTFTSRDARPGGRADQVHVAAQAAPRHRALHLPGRGACRCTRASRPSAAWPRPAG